MQFLITTDHNDQTIFWLDGLAIDFGREQILMMIVEDKVSECEDHISEHSQSDSDFNKENETQH